MTREHLEAQRLGPNSLYELAAEVANLLAGRLNSKDVVRLAQIIFLEVSEMADLLRVKERTIYSWISQGRIPVRYANGKPLFLLSEILQWTLPDNDQHTRHRLHMSSHSRMVGTRLAAIRERE